VPDVPAWADTARRNDLIILRALDETDWATTRVMPKYAGVDSTGCDLWMAKKNSLGYGAVALPKTHWPGFAVQVRAHRVRWIMEHRTPVPYGMELDHVVCSITSCGAPEHLSPSTRFENMRRANTGSMGWCRRGLHEIDADASIGRCRECRAAILRMQDAVRHAAVVAFGQGRRAYRETHGASIERALHVAGMEMTLLSVEDRLTSADLVVCSSTGRGSEVSLFAEIAIQAAKNRGLVL
jgi:hypothetical protein